MILGAVVFVLTGLLGISIFYLRLLTTYPVNTHSRFYLLKYQLLSASRDPGTRRPEPKSASKLDIFTCDLVFQICMNRHVTSCLACLLGVSIFDTQTFWNSIMILFDFKIMLQKSFFHLKWTPIIFERNFFWFSVYASDHVLTFNRNTTRNTIRNKNMKKLFSDELRIQKKQK